ncbi:MAG: hypothetical protein WBO48_18410 [Candidatus Promineifilaceae bacterium]
MTEETISKKHNRTGLFIGAAFAFMLLLAATFMGGKLIAQNEEGVPLSGITQPITLQDGNVAQSIPAPLMETAGELPARAPETKGLFVGRTDDTLTIGTGNVMAMISTEPNAVPEFSYDGIQQNVLVTNKTRLYIDRTEYAFGQTAVQQKLEEVESLDVLTENAMLEVWGERSGDQIVAEAILMQLPKR